MKLGYMRPSEVDPLCEVQRKKLLEAGCDQIFTETHSSPKKREQLFDLMEHLEKEDEIVVSGLYTLADSTRHLKELLEQIDSKGAFFHSLNDEINTAKGKSYSFQEIVRCLVAFQSDVISEKTKAGLHEAKQKGIAAGRPRKPDENVQKAIAMYESKHYSLAEIKEKTGISKSTLYRYLEN